MATGAQGTATMRKDGKSRISTMKEANVPGSLFELRGDECALILFDPTAGDCRDATVAMSMA